MEPVLGGRDDPGPGMPLAAAIRAAMEPVLGGRDDLPRPPARPAPARCRNGARPWRTGRPPRSCRGSAICCGRNGARPWRTGRPSSPATSPEPASCRNGARPWRTGRPLEYACGVHRLPAPQWSPSLADGTTIALPRPWPGLRRRNGARPWRTGRPSGVPICHVSIACRNGARPWRTGRPEPKIRSDGVQFPPQWSPSLADGTTGSLSQTASTDSYGRNGARPWRTGRLRARRPGRRAGSRRNGARPWRTGRRGCRHPARAGRPAAMEPVLGGRDDGRCAPRPRVRHRGRNGARPWRTGRPDHSAPACHRGAGRNGARPWRTGRHPGLHPPPAPGLGRNGARPWRTGRPGLHLPGLRRPVLAAMEPVLGGRDDAAGVRAAAVRCQAAMEPVLGGRDDAARRRRRGGQQHAAMEPVLGGRDDSLLLRITTGR